MDHNQHMMNFEELDPTTRKWILDEFNAEQSQTPHFEPTELNPIGLAAFPDLMRQAIQHDNIASLAASLSNSSYWKPTRTYYRKGKPITQNIDPTTSAQRLAHSEFTTWYTRGMARKLKEEGITQCQVYRADSAVQPNCECTSLEGNTVSVDEIYNGHRAKYFPTPNQGAFSIPSSPFCHHTIRRLTV